MAPTDRSLRFGTGNKSVAEKAVPKTWARTFQWSPHGKANWLTPLRPRRACLMTSSISQTSMLRSPTRPASPWEPTIRSTDVVFYRNSKGKREIRVTGCCVTTSRIGVPLKDRNSCVMKPLSYIETVRSIECRVIFRKKNVLPRDKPVSRVKQLGINWKSS